MNAPHLLVVRDAEDMDFDVWHPSSCPHEEILAPQFFVGRAAVHRHRECVEQYEIDGVGLDAFDPIPAVGVHAFRSWAYWSGSMFEDADGGSDIVFDDLLPRLP